VLASCCATSFSQKARRPTCRRSARLFLARAGLESGLYSTFQFIVSFNWSRLADVCCAEKTHRASTSGGVEFRYCCVSAAIYVLIHDTRIEDSSSWSNLPLAGEDLAVVITFSLDVAPFEQLQKFWNEYLSKVCCIIAYSTTSVYEVGISLLVESHEWLILSKKVAAPEAVVDESSPLTGKDLRGQSLENRIRAEEFLREKGAIILTLRLVMLFNCWLTASLVVSLVKIAELVQNRELFTIKWPKVNNSRFASKEGLHKERE